MKNYKRLLFLSLAGVMLFCAGCNKKDDAPKAEEQTTEQTVQTTQSEIKQEYTPVLKHKYTTQFETKNAVTFPDFTFEYPDGWEIIKEEVTMDGERVELKNKRGATVIFSHIGGVGEDYDFGGSAVSMARVEVTKAGESKFVPDYVQDNDHSSLGKFMVAKLKVTGQMDMKLDEDFENVDGAVSYAVLPESRVGVKDDVRAPYEAEFSFWYSGHIAMLADAPDGSFTAEEEKDVLAILGSFRV